MPYTQLHPLAIVESLLDEPDIFSTYGKPKGGKAPLSQSDLHDLAFTITALLSEISIKRGKRKINFDMTSSLQTQLPSP